MMLQPKKDGTSYFNKPMEIASHRRSRSFPKEFYASLSWQLRLIITLPHGTLTPSRLPSVWRDSTISGSFTLKNVSKWILILRLPPPPSVLLSVWLQGHLVNWFLHHAFAVEHQMHVLGHLRNLQHASSVYKSHIGSYRTAQTWRIRHWTCVWSCLLCQIYQDEFPIYSESF